MKLVLLLALTVSSYSAFAEICGVSVTETNYGNISSYSGKNDQESDLRIIPLNLEALRTLEEAAKYRHGVKTVCITGTVQIENMDKNIVYAVSVK